MYKKFLLLLLAGSCFLTSSAQTLFTYGNQSADAGDFLRAYKKNNSTPSANKAKAIADYLELYINSRLKIREAYARGYDTIAQIKTEVNTLRLQIAENYMNDPEASSRLLKEAFRRSLKDIRVAHIFISLKDAEGHQHEGEAEKKRDDILKKLTAGEDFLKLAEQFSDDPSAKATKGELGFITVFTLPYEFENAIYKTSAGKNSLVVSSKAGYHIFRNMGERKAVGKIKAQQILLAIPTGSDDNTKKKIALLADSLYKRLLAGEEFGKLAAAFSNDYISATNGGNMPDIGPGTYDPAFETVLWSLPKDGATSKPFLTSHGWHILKRISIKPVITDSNNRTNMSDLQQQLIADSRWTSSKDFIYKSVKEKAGFKKFTYNEAAFWAMTDSLLDLKPMTEQGRTIKSTTPLFSIGDSIYSAATWINYAKVFRYKQDGTGPKPHGQVRDEFEQSALYNYYRDHLEEFNPEFRRQMAEFRDGNLFFEIMQQEVWNKAQTDSAALLALYEKNKKNYTWKQSADAVIFFCSDEATAKTIYEEIKKNPAAWASIIEKNSDHVVADSSRFEWSQIPNLVKGPPKAGMLTTPLVNQSDKSASFAYIVQVYHQPMQRSFAEARGMVINDYQVLLEDEWIAELRKKYPVVVNKSVLAQISK